LNLRTLQKHWDLFGARDPLWAILTSPQKKNSRWDPAEFFQTGVWEIGEALRYVESRQPLAQKKTALDFGCGVGRLTQALATHFEQVHGIDISPSMIDHANHYNRFGDRCRYVLNQSLELTAFKDHTFDFIYSNITLQHMPPRYSRQYIAEFLRLLAPHGVLLFQLVSRSRATESRLTGGLRRFYYRVLWDFLQPSTPLMDMYPVAKEEVVSWITSAGGRVLDVAADRAAEPDWEGYRYLVDRASSKQALILEQDTAIRTSS
jgi:ubiquinone/menaquinone biosynthesis C-methylase UbiE